MENGKITAETKVSTTELACVLGVTGRRIRQLTEDGQLEKVQGKFLLCESVQRYLSSRSKNNSDEDKKIEEAQKKAELTLKVSKSQIAKMQADELRGKMHRSEDVAAMTEDLIYAIRGALISLPGRLAVDVSATDSPAEAANVIRKEVHKVMEELSRYKYDPKKYEERVRERQKWDSPAGDIDGE